MTPLAVPGAVALAAGVDVAATASVVTVPGAGPLVSTTVGGTTVGLARPLAVAAAPLAVAALAWLIWRGTGAAGRRSRGLLFASRVAVALLLATAAAGPYTVTTAETPGEPRVTLVTDDTDSMDALADPGDLAGRIEREGVPVTEVSVGEGTGSRVGDVIAANLRENGTVVVASDGRVTEGRSLAEAGDVATGLNATVAAVSLDAARTERTVDVTGPAKTSVGVTNRFLVEVDGVDLGAAPTTVTVTVDGRQVATERVTGAGRVEVTHRFERTGSHRVVVEASGRDAVAANDVARLTVRAVERPRVLYVSDLRYPLEGYLSELYAVDTSRRVPADLSPYYAVVLQNKPASEVGNVTALQEFVIEGNGLMVVGGSRAFERGGYADSPLGSMLPVRAGEGTEAGASARVVLAIDVSASAEQGMVTQKAVALSVLNQLGGENTVGLVGFNERAYRVAEPARLSGGRLAVEESIRRLQAGGGTSVAAGLRGASRMLGGAGTIILISDGRDRGGGVERAAEELPEDVRVITVGSGPSPRTALLEDVARRTGGTYVRADETTRLRILFGGADRTFSADALTVVDSTDFVTSGVRLTSNPGLANEVEVKPGASYLVATGSGTPAVTSWRYGLGRVVAFTTYDTRDTLDGLLARPDSLLVTKATNYAIGDPERRAAGVTEAPDTRVGVPTTVTYRGPDRPAVDAPTFRRVGDGEYRATITPRQPGFGRVLDATYAVDAHPEYAAFGRAPALRRLVESTGGRTFEPTEAAAIARYARERATGLREVRESWAWLALALAVVAFAVEVCLRRLQVYRGRALDGSGLP